MGKSSRSNLAAELDQPGNQDDAGGTSNGPAELQSHDEFSAQYYDGLVVLDPRRNAAKSGGRRSSRQKTPRGAELSKIGEQLRSLYDDVLSQPVPDRFLELLNKLESDTISPTRSKAPGER